MMKQGKVAAGSKARLARGMVGAGVAKGTPRPDIHRRPHSSPHCSPPSRSRTPDRERRSQRRLFRQAGRANRHRRSLKAKLSSRAGGPAGYAATFVVKGEAEFALQPIPELMAVPGIEIVGPLPGAFQNVTTYAAGIPTGAKEADAAKALDKSPRHAIERRGLRARGLEPG